MLATLSGDLCLLFGLALLLLPLLAVELSRPRDGVWGAVVLLLVFVVWLRGMLAEGGGHKNGYIPGGGDLEG
mgnify:CR=1 FL=1